MKGRTPPRRSDRDRALEAIYAEIPRIPDCTGECATACTGIAMFKGEWERVVRSFGRTPRRLQRADQKCPMLSPTGKCMVYSVRPYICRLWGTTRELRCPKGCKPERWLSLEESLDIFSRISEVAGPEVAGPLGGIGDLWRTLGLPERQERRRLIEMIQTQLPKEQDDPV